MRSSAAKRLASISSRSVPSRDTPATQTDPKFAINVDLTALVQQQVTEFVGDRKALAHGSLVPINADHCFAALPIELAAFIVRAERISETMQAEMECGNRPIGPAIVELTRRRKRGHQMECCIRFQRL